MSTVDRYEDIPEHHLAAMSEAERNYYRRTLNGPKLGNPWITARRKLEAQTEGAAKHEIMGRYFPHEALQTFERFTALHWEGEPTIGEYSLSPVRDRIATHYLQLFPNLRARLVALFIIPRFAGYSARFEEIEEAYYADLGAADHLARNLAGTARTKRLHDDYRLAFGNICRPLEDLLRELVAISELTGRR